MGSLDSFGDVRNFIDDFKLYRNIKKYNLNFFNIINCYTCNVQQSTLIVIYAYFLYIFSLIIHNIQLCVFLN